MGRHDVEGISRTVWLHPVVFTHFQWGKIDDQFSSTMPNMDVRRFVVASVNHHLETVLSKNGWHIGESVP